MQKNSFIRTNWSLFLLSACLFLITTIYAIPHTIALRNVLLGAGLVACVTQLWRFPQLQKMPLVAGVLLTLTIWLWIQAIYISPDPVQAMDSVRGDWMVPLAVFIFGLLFYLRIERDLGQQDTGRLIATLILAGLYVMIFFCLIEQGCIWLQEGSFPFGYARFGNRDNLSVLTNTALSLIIADFLARSILKKNATLIPPTLLIILFFIGLLATYTLTTRNGTIGVVLFVAIMLGMLLSRTNLSRKTYLSCIVLILLVPLLAVGSYKTDSRWQQFGEAVNIALDTEHNRFWLNDQIYPRPQTASGIPLEESAYKRIAWAKEAVRQIIKHPLGVGYNHQALGAALHMEYSGEITVGASHNGLLELALGGGLPALALWTIFTILLLHRGWVSFFKDRNPSGMLLFFSVLCYFSRCALDGHLTGHRLEMFMLFSALLAANCCMNTRNGK